ncbi:TadE/TadG family type IV pilus assembly protein [Devosia sp. CAU 1758]
MFDRFLRDRDGNVAIIVALLIMPMLVLAGGATDIARYEAHRAQLQDGIDRAVLAAASLSQTVPVETTVADYLKTLAFVDDVVLDYDYAISINTRIIKVTASYEMPTGFLPLINITDLPIIVTATAQERRSNLEISLILDVSGSMRFGSPMKIGLLRPAAKQFIDAMLTPANAPTTSISIVPYAGSVNVGSVVMNGIGVQRQHSYSSCMEFATTDYAANVGLIPFHQRTQVPHFTQNHANTNEPGLDWGYCPSEVTAISYISNDPTALKNKIDNMRMADGTGTGIAMKWGMLLLEPAAQPFVAQAAGLGMVPAQFANRPSQFDDPNTIKIVVLMTDGDIQPQMRPNQYAYPRNPEGGGGNYQWYNAGTANTHLQSVCSRAKNNGVIVFTIGFQVSNTGRSQMQSCASSASHYYDVSGLDIAGAFNSIATAIQKVKLTQ